ncbi:MAG: hypothetical protein A4E65_03405 [Syntrophorhabdus sp. PtaU1.Bin153]|nr:MAG: hypothetical protein A4E65_03405 [Syntrophorhabdus sp. PtaU1.Bin153]
MKRKAMVIEACGLCKPYYNAETKMCMKDVDGGGPPLPVPDRTKIADFCGLDDLNGGDGGCYCTHCGTVAYIGIFDVDGFLVDTMCCDCFAAEFNQYMGKAAKILHSSAFN